MMSLVTILSIEVRLEMTFDLVTLYLRNILYLERIHGRSGFVAPLDAGGKDVETLLSPAWPHARRRSSVRHLQSRAAIMSAFSVPKAIVSRVLGLIRQCRVGAVASAIVASSPPGLAHHTRLSATANRQQLATSNRNRKSVGRSRWRTWVDFRRRRRAGLFSALATRQLRRRSRRASTRTRRTRLCQRRAPTPICPPPSSRNRPLAVDVSLPSRPLSARA